MTQAAQNAEQPSRADLVAGLVSAMANPARSPILRSPADDGIAFSEVFFPAMDGVTIEGWFIPGDSDRLIIANHPIWANRYGFPATGSPTATRGRRAATTSKSTSCRTTSTCTGPATTSWPTICATSAKAPQAVAA